MRAPGARPEHGFLGEEFLTWLWFTLETRGGDFALERGAVSVAMDDLIAFAPLDDDETEQTLRKGLPSRSAEARAALRNGRRVRRLRLIVAAGARQWTLTVDGPSLDLIGVRLPADAEGITSPRERATARIAAFVEVHEIVTGLYGRFLADRLRPEYLTTTAASQAAWMQG